MKFIIILLILIPNITHAHDSKNINATATTSDLYAPWNDGILVPNIQQYRLPVQLHAVSTYCLGAFEALKEANPRVTRAYCDYWYSLLITHHAKITTLIDLNMSPREYWDLIQK